MHLQRATKAHCGPILAPWTVVFLGVTFSGCMQSGSALTTLNVSRKILSLPAPTVDVVQLQYTFLERDIQDPTLRETIWKDADEQSVPLDLRNSLNNHGFRVAKLGSRLSPEIAKLIKEADGKTQARISQASSGSVTKIQTTEVLPMWNLFTFVNGHAKGETINDAQGFLHIIPKCSEGKCIDVAFLPEIEFGQPQNRRVPNADFTGWQFQQKREAKTFHELRFTLPLESGDFALIGCWPESAGSLGAQFFTRVQADTTKNYVVLVRAMRPTKEELFTAGNDLDDFFLSPLTRSAADARTNVRETILASRRAQLQRGRLQ